MDACNPNWVAFAASQGEHPKDLPAGATTNAAYINWISEQAADFTAKTGITKETHPGEYPALFSEWLTDAYPAPDDDEPDDGHYHRMWEASHPVLAQPYYDGGRLVRPR